MFVRSLFVVAPFALALSACGRPIVVEPAISPTPRVTVDLAAPGPIVHEVVVSARWEVPLSGLLDLEDPAAEHLADEPYPIVLPVHLLTHPEHGLFVVDTGVAREPAVIGLVRGFLGDVEVEEPLGDILERQTAPLAGVLLTHNHLDHVLGLPDVPASVPVYAGPGEDHPHAFSERLAFGTFRRGLGDRPLTTWVLDDAPSLGPVAHAVDVLGDGSLWALHAPGHTPGSMAFVARTVDGPVLFAGDTSHTRFGWDHGVTPGTYTVDHARNAASLSALRELAATYDMRVEVGHEIDPSFNTPRPRADR